MHISHNQRNLGGFTLMELMIAIAILAILVTAAVPSVQNILRSNQVAGQTNDIVSMLNFARNTAIRRSGDVNVVFSSNTSGSGWSGFVEDPDGKDTNNDCTAANALRCTTNKDVSLQLASDTETKKTFTFDKRGYRAGAFNDDGTITIETLWLEHESCSSSQHRSRIELRPTGQVTSCNVPCKNTDTICQI